jgi:hypothetical protein
VFFSGVLVAGTTTARGEEAHDNGLVRASRFQLDLVPGVAIVQRAPGIAAGASIAGLVAIGDRWSLGFRASGASVLSYMELDVETLGANQPTAGMPSGLAPRAVLVGLLAGDAELRYHPLMVGALDTYVGAETGLAAAQFVHEDMRVGPHLGACAGVDLHPARALSIGVGVRGGGALFSITNEGSRLFPEAMLGAVLGFHVPAEPARANVARAPALVARD